MNKDAYEYIQQNKDHYPREVLVGKLKNAGYPDRIIGECLTAAYGPDAGRSGASGDFWDFKNEKKYASSNQKVGDFLLAFIFGWVLFGFLDEVGDEIGMLIFFVFVVIASVKLYNRRRFVSIGLISIAVIMLLLTGEHLLYLFL